MRRGATAAIINIGQCGTASVMMIRAAHGAIAILLSLLFLCATCEHTAGAAINSQADIHQINHQDTISISDGAGQHRNFLSLVVRNSLSIKQASGGGVVVRESASTNSSQSTQLLAVKDNRIDPLDHFRKYKGGYNLKSKHYLASTVYTGVHGYAIGLLWVVATGLIICAIILCWTWKKTKRRLARQHDKHVNLSLQKKTSLSSVVPQLNEINSSIRCKTTKRKIFCLKLLPLSVVILLTSIAMACCGVVLVENQRFYNVAKKVEKTIIMQGAVRATQEISNVTIIMTQIKVDMQSYDTSVSQRVDTATSTLNHASMTLIQIVHDRKHLIDKALNYLKIVVAIIGSTNIVVWTVGLGCVYLCRNHTWLLFLLLAFAWFLVFINWLSFGITFALGSFSDDTCEALYEYQGSMSQNTTLDSLLPCNDLATGNKIILKLRQEVYDFMNQANTNITKINMNNDQELAKGSLVSIPYLCNPFWGPPDYLAKDNCTANTIPLATLPQFLSLLKCQEGSSDNNGSMTCIPSQDYGVAIAYINATQKLVSLLPQVQSLTNCSFVADTFSIILTDECKPLKRSIKMVWVGLLVLSCMSIFIFLIWLGHVLLFKHSMRKIQSTNARQDGSILPHDSPSSPREHGHGPTLANMKS